MNLDDVVQSIPDSERALRVDLAHWVHEWKQSAESIERLAYLIDKWHGNVWFKKDSDSNDFYRNWCHFKELSIDGIGGMTVNERLYSFGLLELWDSSDENFRATLRAKLNAHV